MNNPAQEEEDSGFARALYDWLQALAVALVCIILIFVFVGRFIYVDGDSMNPTLWDKDMMVVQTLGYTPAQGDVVVLTKYFANVRGPIVKRVIAVGGQTVDIDYDAGTVTVDGVKLSEPYIKEPMQQPFDSRMGNEHVVVPEGSVFVMGDNRNNSSDSRFLELGTVDERYVIGRAFFVTLPFGHFGTIE
nr:signal peptidase I [Pseudoflavonifractor phocaeensis]